MDLATVVLFFPLLGGAHGSESLPQLFEEYSRRSAAASATVLLRSAGDRSPAERSITAFLLANDLAELGFRDLAGRELHPLLTSPTLGPAAFLSLVRILDEDEQDERLLEEARRASWADLDDEEFAEATFRVARSCMRQRRWAQAREWLKQVPTSSAYHVPSRYLLAQTEYALGRLPQAIEAIDSVFLVPARDPETGWMKDRTAIFAGEMLTEVGLYSDAVSVFAWPAKSSPFRARADREARLAEALAEVIAAADGDVDKRLGPPPTAATAEARARAARELERAWPSQPLREARRHFAVAAARRAYDREQGVGWRRAVDLVWWSLPPVALYEALGSEHLTAPSQNARLGAEASAFFTPRPEIANLLTAIALAGEATSGGRDCPPRALAVRAAQTLAATSPPPTRAELTTLAGSAGSCDGGDTRTLLPSLRAKLDQAIEREAVRREHVLRSQRYLVEETLAAARLERQATLQAARGENR